MCGTLCLQHKVNEKLDKIVKDEIKLKSAKGKKPLHVNFI